MSRFTIRQMKTILQQQEYLLDLLEDSCSEQMHLKELITEGAETYAGSEARELLDTVSIQELAPMLSGVRLGPFLKNGYLTLGDIARAGQQELTAIHGVSEEGAYRIKSVVHEVERSNRTQIKIRLSADHKTSEASELIFRLYHYRKIRAHLDQCQQIYARYSGEILPQIRVLREGLGLIRWLFTRETGKNRVYGAASILESYSNGEYGIRTRKEVGAIHQIQTGLRLEDAWTDFEENSADYFSVLEELAPGLLGSDDLLYGLAPDIAENVITEDLDLSGLKCTLRKYQRMGVQYILHQKNVLLGDEMGLGKTIQAIAAMTVLANRGAKQFLVVCPASVLPNWCREIEKHSQLPVRKLHGTDKQKELDRWKKEGGVAVVTYDSASFVAPGPEELYSLLIVDEAHYIKNPEARRTVHVKRLCNHSERLLFMTGTPIENCLEEMILLIEMLRPDVAQRLRNRTRALTSPLFRVEAAEVYYRRKRTDVLKELPDLIMKEDWCEMNREERRAYYDTLQGTNLQAIRRVSWNVSELGYSGKAAKLLEIVEEAQEDGRKILVFSYFLDTLAQVQKLFGNRCLPPITGALTPQRRQEILQQFHEAPAGTVLAAQIIAGGTGLNIQSASVVVLCEPQMKPSIENQAISRAYRMGQTRNVLVHRLLCEDSIDERMMEILDRKQEIFDQYADRSVAAETAEISEKLFAGLLEKERQRIDQE